MPPMTKPRIIKFRYCFHVFLPFIVLLQNLPAQVWKKSFQNRKNSELWSGIRTARIVCLRQVALWDLGLLNFSIIWRVRGEGWYVRVYGLRRAEWLKGWRTKPDLQ